MSSTNSKKMTSRRLARLIATRIRQLREARGWSQERLASETGLSNDGIVRIERGDRVPRIDTLERVALALGVSLTVILDFDKPLPQLTPSRDSEPRAQAIKDSLDQLPPWLSEALSTALRYILRAARESERRAGSKRGTTKE